MRCRSPPDGKSKNQEEVCLSKSAKKEKRFGYLTLQLNATKHVLKIWRGTTVGQVRSLIIQSMKPTSIQIQNLKVSMSGKSYNLLEVDGDKTVDEMGLFPRFRVKILYSSSEKNVILHVSEESSKSLVVMDQEEEEGGAKDDSCLDIEQDVVRRVRTRSARVSYIYTHSFI